MKTNKPRLLVTLLLAICCLMAFSVTALAADNGCYASDETGTATPPDSIDSISISTAAVSVSSDTSSTALTPDGNLSLVDDILQDESNYVQDEQTVRNKQFITVQSKNGNTFYIVIDRSDDTENVYFLNLVDESDLMALMEDGELDDTPVCTCADKCEAGEVNTDCSVCKTNMSECMGKEEVKAEKEPEAETDEDTKEDETKTKSSKAPIVVVFLLVLGGGGALYWFKLRKKKPDTKGSTDLDDYDFGDEDDDEEYEVESDEDTNNEESEGE